jgi:restriction endonuclease S subunit
LFIDAVNEVTRERAASFLKPEHQQRIVDAYQTFREASFSTFEEAASFLEGKFPGFARAVNRDDLAQQNYSLSIPLYVKRTGNGNAAGDDRSLPELWTEWEQSGREFWQEMDALVGMLDGLTRQTSQTSEVSKTSEVSALPGSWELPTALPHLPGSWELPGRSHGAGWQMVKFGDVVRLNTDRMADPAAAGIERYVGLEHIEPEDLRIRRWGLVAEGITFTNCFKPGQTLFGQRRAYQRKVAVADFSGVCSGDIYVFEPNDPAVLLPELLPFICQTERFYQHAVGTSAGSLSPRTNWTQLAQYEFPLPPLAEQRRIAEVLWGGFEMIDALRGVVETSVCTEEAFLLELFGLYSNDNPRWQKIRLDQLAYIQTGVAKGKKTDPEKTIDVPYIGVSNVQDGFLDLSEIKLITVEKDKVEQVRLQIGDVLMTEGGDPDKLGRGTVWQGEIEGCIHQNHIFAVRTNPNQLNPWFLAAVTRSSYGKQYFLGCSKRTSNLATINKKQVSEFLVPCPDIIKQKEIVSDWKAIRSASDQARKRLRHTEQIQNSLLNSIRA